MVIVLGDQVSPFMCYCSSIIFFSGSNFQKSTLPKCSFTCHCITINATLNEKFQLFAQYDGKDHEKTKNTKTA